MKRKIMAPFMIRHKYNAQKTIVDGVSFPSRLEATVYAELRLREKAGELTELKLQDRVELSKANISCKIDFRYLDLKTNELVWAEGKGLETERWGMIKRLWKHYGPGRLDIYKANSRGIYLAETITP